MNTLKTQLIADMKSCMKSGDKASLMVIRYFLSGIKNFEIDNGEISDEQIINLARKEIKQLNETIVEYKTAGRDELIDEEKNKIVVMQKYLPAELSDEELKAKVASILENVEKDNFGLAMREAMKELNGKADGQRITKFVKEVLN
jgi:uncharacterized protein YqeY